MISLYALGRVQESDFLLLRNWNRKATLIDVGANGGQSALAMSLVCPSATITSFEANEKNISDLRLIQRILGEPDWTQRMTPEDLRALTPLIYTHVTPYGMFRLDMSKRLDIDAVRATA